MRIAHRPPMKAIMTTITPMTLACSGVSVSCQRERTTCIGSVRMIDTGMRGQDNYSLNFLQPSMNQAFHSCSGIWEL